MAAEPKSERARVRCVINGEEIDVWEGYRLWDAALDADARLWKWCGGDGQCATCAVIPVSGAENLSPPTKLERFSLAHLVRQAARPHPQALEGQADPARLPVLRATAPSRSSALFGKKAKAREPSGMIARPASETAPPARSRSLLAGGGVSFVGAS